MSEGRTKKQSDALSKAARLAIGGDVAPVLRQRAGAPRRVTLVDRDGKPVGVSSDIEIAASLLARSAIEFSVQDDRRPAFVNCGTCGQPIVVAKKGPIPSVCQPNAHRCKCGKPINVHARCGLGLECKSCRSKKHVLTLDGASHVRKYSDEQIRAAVAEESSFRSAAAALGMSETAFLYRAKRLGVAPSAAARDVAVKEKMARLRSKKRRGR